MAAAQRRLAALAEQHSRAQTPQSAARGQGVAAAPQSRASGGLPLDLDDPGDLVIAPDRPPLDEPAYVARHAGVRRSELGRWGVSAQHVTVAALLVVGLVVAVAWWALRSVPHAETVQVSSQRYVPSPPPAVPPTSAATTSHPSGQGGAPSATVSSTRLVVDVAGKVRHPGIVELPPGSRVVDAIVAAGGTKPGVSLTSLNLARLLVDGEQIIVGLDVPVVPGGPSNTSGSGGAATTTVAPIDLNTATEEQLESLPDVGPVTAQAILTWRTDNGPFSNVDDLLEVSGIGQATLADIRPYVYV